MPPNTVYVGRGSVWGNPYRIGVDGDAAQCVAQYARQMVPFKHGDSLRIFLMSEAAVMAIQEALRGKNLACWCPLDKPCHADWLLKVANDDDFQPCACCVKLFTNMPG